jgi:MEDS: MEthanogen/methylotroph, DcmR Sensory domain
MFCSHRMRSTAGMDGLLQWGDHVCHFFRSATGLGEVLVPYFKAGLERGEFCIWVTSRPYGKDRAASEMRAAMSDFDRRIAAGQIQVFDLGEWYAKLAKMSTAEQIRAWLSQTDEAIQSGYTGLRGTGNASFLDESNWEDFQVYERAVDAAFKGQRIIALCSYCMDDCSADAVVDVRQSHALSLAKRDNRWDLIEMRTDRQSSAVGRGSLTSWAWMGRELRVVIEDQLAIYMEAYPKRITLNGGRVRLSGPQATKLAFLINELVMDAAKYGALASTQGKLAVQWRVNGSRRLRITWTESGMPRFSITNRRRLGTELRADAERDCVRTFDATGTACAFEVDLESDLDRR